MPDKTLRGQGLGGKSLADSAGVELAARQDVAFICPNDHEFSLTFAAEAELPTLWECPRCGTEARRADGVEPEVKEGKAPRTHWDMLRERRSIEELEGILAERLQEIRTQD
ncbi:RNA polymerase-binding protein RbpA [Propioniciclava soli]|uniref:RNA polymerase-binding protein RbpA n=1 Tax=Propioniciclava soli TaxID=2775081 RepID=A0ABZ3CCC6_9ACTN|nr:RNA polymerase-binding protein RbpA [Propioniciclava soli]